jgi:hypothetical protein
MIQYNPLTKPEGGKDRVLVESGEYIAHLESIKLKEQLDRETNKMVPKLDFKFVLIGKEGSSEDVSGSYVLQRVSTSTWAKKGKESGLIKLLSLLDFLGLKKIPMEDEFCYDRNALWAFCQSLVGTVHKITVENTGKYNNFITSTPVRSESKKAKPASESSDFSQMPNLNAKATPVADKMPKSPKLEDDNIPF